MIILDFDGTLVDSMPALTELAVAVLQQYFPHEDAAAQRQAYLNTIGRPFADQLRMIYPLCDITPAAAEFEVRKEAITLQSPLMGGAREFIERHVPNERSVDAGVAIVSSTTAHLVECYLKKHGLLESVTYDGWSAGRSKYRQLWCLRCVTRDLHFIGDAPYDGQLADTLGIPFTLFEGPQTWMTLA